MLYKGMENVPGAPGNLVAGGNLGYFAGTNPLLDPRFKIQGGEPWNKTPLLPGKDTQQYEQQQFNIPLQPQLPAAGINNVGGLISQQPQANSQDVGGFDKLLEGLEEQNRLRMLGSDQMQIGPNQLVSYPMQRRPF